MTQAKELASKISKLYQDNCDYHTERTSEELESDVESLLNEALQELFAHGRLDAQYDNDTLPEQIEAYKRKAKREAFLEAAEIVSEHQLPDGNEFYWYKQQTAVAEILRRRAEEVGK